MCSVGGRKALDEQSGGRFLFGLGVSHKPAVEGSRGQVYEKPLARMRSYLEQMARSSYYPPAPTKSGEMVLAALRPGMLKLSAELTDGAHPYNVPPEHTALAREILGPNKRLYVEQLVILETDADKARASAKKFLELYISLENYRNAWISLGYSEEEIYGRADRFIDAIAAWGDESAIRKRLDEHWRAGADHVCIQAISSQDNSIDQKALEIFSPAKD